MSAPHDPVLVRETLAFLAPRAGLYLDATLGDGGHAEALLSAGPDVRLLASDRDPASLAFARDRLGRFGARVTFAHGTFRDLPAAHAALGERLAGALFDFGLSSRQIDDPARGMSYRSQGLAEKLANVTEEELADVLRTHGDLSHSLALARAILAEARAGRLTTTTALAELSGRVLRDSRPGAVAPVFQALRVWVNDEMADLEAALTWLPGVMDDGGVAVTLAYHSGEDRRVKQALRGPVRAVSRRLPPAAEGMPGPWEELTRRVVTPSEEEIRRNPRARSARLRAFRRKPR